MSQMDGNGRDVILENPRTVPIRSVAGSGLYRRRNTLPPTAPPSEDEVAELAKGIFLAVVDVLPEYSKKALEPLRTELLESGASAAGRVIQKELDALRTEFKGQLDTLVKTYERLLTEQKSAHVEQMDRLLSVIKALPTPTVNVPENAIGVKMIPSTVNVSPHIHVPDKAISVNVKSEPSIVNLPKDSISVNVKSEPSIVNVPKEAITIQQVASQVQFTVPEKAFRLEASPPRTQKTMKKIEYDNVTGRPVRIEEVQTEEGPTTEAENDDIKGE